MPLKGSRNTPLTKPEVAGLGGPGTLSVARGG